MNAKFKTLTFPYRALAIHSRNNNGNHGDNDADHHRHDRDNNGWGGIETGITGRGIGTLK